MSDTQALLQQLSSVRQAMRRAAAAGGLPASAVADADQQVAIALDMARAMDAFKSNDYGRAEVRRPLPTRMLRPSGVQSVASGATSNAYPIQWPATGLVTGIACGTIDNTLASLGAMSARVTMRGTTDLFSDGQAGAYAQFSTGFSNPDGQQQWWPCLLPFTQGDQWQVYFKNESAAGPFTPVILFQYVETPH